MRPGGPESLLGRTISGRYRIERVVGEGGMGAVYAAEHLHMRKRMAVKILHPEMSRLPEVVARFEREAMAAAHIDHPNVAAATDFGKLEDGSFFLVLEYIEGKSLREVLGQGRLPLPRALHVMDQIASALGRANGIGIVHRDLKPENVMLIQRDGDPDFVKVLDFGIAKVPVGELGADGPRGPAQPVLTQLGMVYGTPEYMAPEQALGQPVDHRADLYALGVITFEMLTGVRPFDHESKVTLLGMHVTAPVPTMAALSPDANVPPEIEAIVDRLLAKEAGARFANARELLDATISALTALVQAGRLDPGALEQVLGDASMSSSLRSPSRNRASLVDAALGSGPAVSVRAGSAPDAARAKLGTMGTEVAAPTPAPRPGKLSLRSVPMKTWAMGGAALGVVLFAILFFTALSGGSSTHAEAAGEGGLTQLAGEVETGVKVKSPTANNDAIVLAAEKLLSQSDAPGAVKLLVPIEQAEPRRADVHRDLERCYAAEHDVHDLLQEAERWIATDPAAADDRGLAEDVRAAALGREAPDEAFTLLAGTMGSVGVDILYDLAYAKPPSPVAARAKKMLLLPEVRSHASSAALVALDLHAAERCDTRKAILARARDTGDARALAVLTGWTATRGCGFLGAGDCWPCLHRDGTLAGAIAAIQARAPNAP